MKTVKKWIFVLMGLTMVLAGLASQSDPHISVVFCTGAIILVAMAIGTWIDEHDK